MTPRVRRPCSDGPAPTGVAAMKAIVRVMPKPGVLDPEGKAIARALGHLGFEGIGDVRAGKLIEVELATADAKAAREAAAAMAEALLANTVIESFSVEIA